MTDLAQRRVVCRRRPRPLRVTWCLVLGLWVGVLTGPLGFGAGFAHHHVAGQADDACPACVLMHAATVTVPAQPVLLAAPAEVGSLAAFLPLPAPPSESHSPARPRSPPVAIST